MPEGNPGPIILLGLGFTTSRLARRLISSGYNVLAAVREPSRHSDLARAGVRVDRLIPGNFPRSSILVHTIPTLPEEDARAIRTFIQEILPQRIVYISSTGVYGEQAEVDHRSIPAPADEKGHLRMEEERWIAGGAWRSLIVRPAAIYGPGRGVHMRLREGKRPRAGGSGMVSRIHVDDLVSVLEAGIRPDLEGAWPLADERPCSTAEIVAWCSELLGLEPGRTGKEFPVAGRHVDGSEILRRLSVTLRYPDYKSGIPASIQEETAEESEI